MDETPRNASDEIRYQGKAVDDDEWIADFLAGQAAGVLGVVDGDEPHLVTQLFVADPEEGAIYLHGAQGGRTYGVVEGREVRGCFTASEMGRFLPAAEPVNFSVEYASVVAYGTLSLLEGREEKRRVLEGFMEKFAPHLTAGEDYEPMRDDSVDRTAVYRLAVESWSGKEGWKEPAFEGAYDLDSVRVSER